MKRFFSFTLLICSLAVFSACSASDVKAQATTIPAQPITTDAPVPASTIEDTSIATPVSTPEPILFSVSSDGIINGIIQDAYGMRAEQKTRGVPNRSLPLVFNGIPEGTACLALSMIDPDGGDWVHWLAVDLPLDNLADNASVDLVDKIIQGKNDFGFTGYGGPTPPSGTHTYVFTIYALSEPLELKNGFSLAAFEQAIEGAVLATAELKGDYSH